jgi:hypothetical protein
MVAAFNGVYLIRLNVDHWGWGVPGTGFDDVDLIPIFFRLDDEGHPTGDTIDGTAWEDNTPENMSAALGPWFHQP